MKEIWDINAKNGRKKVADYIRERFGVKSVKKFRQEVEQTTKMLKDYPNIGSIDPLFADRPKAYRSVIIGDLSKMVYFVEEDIIHIAAFWDIRQDPMSQAAKTTEEKPTTEK